MYSVQILFKLELDLVETDEKNDDLKAEATPTHQRSSFGD